MNLEVSHVFYIWKYICVYIYILIWIMILIMIVSHVFSMMYDYIIRFSSLIKLSSELCVVAEVLGQVLNSGGIVRPE